MNSNLESPFGIEVTSLVREPAADFVQRLECLNRTIQRIYEIREDFLAGTLFHSVFHLDPTNRTDDEFLIPAFRQMSDFFAGLDHSETFEEDIEEVSKTWQSIHFAHAAVFSVRDFYDKQHRTVRHLAADFHELSEHYWDVFAPGCGSVFNHAPLDDLYARGDLTLAELAGWLHDFRSLTFGDYLNWDLVAECHHTYVNATAESA